MSHVSGALNSSTTPDRRRLPGPAARGQDSRRCGLAGLPAPCSRHRDAHGELLTQHSKRPSPVSTQRIRRRHPRMATISWWVSGGARRRPAPSPRGCSPSLSAAFTVLQPTMPFYNRTGHRVLELRAACVVVSLFTKPARAALEGLFWNRAACACRPPSPPSCGSGRDLGGWGSWPPCCSFYLRYA